MRKLKLKIMLILFAMVPLVITTVALTIANITSAKNNLESQMESTLRTAAEGLRMFAENEMKKTEDIQEFWNNIDTSHSYVDHLKDKGIELTLFKNDTRHRTSLSGKAENGRNEGTKANEDVIEAVIGKKSEYTDNACPIAEKRYFVSYVPIKDSTGAVVGMAFAGQLYANVQDKLNSTITSSVIIAVILVVVLVAVCLYLASKVAKPIAGCANVLEAMAGGDLSNEINYSSIVLETGMLIDASQTLSDKLNDIMGQTKNVAQALKSGASEVSELATRSSEGANQIVRAMEDLTQGATSLAQNVQGINEQTLTMGSSIETISENASELVVASNNIKSANTDAGEYITKVSDFSAKSVKAVNDIENQIKETNDAVQRVKEAVEMISSVANQTNLLALNASIEAARAGEAGRGFAVVATEIGSLSDQSNASASEIKGIVDEIIKKSEASVKLSSDVASIISEQQGYIDETGNKFNVLNTEIEHSLSGINAISERISALEGVKDSIVSAVQDLSAISEENAASNQQVSASLTSILESISDIANGSVETDEKAKELNEVVSYFN